MKKLLSKTEYNNCNMATIKDEFNLSHDISFTDHVKRLGIYNDTDDPLWDYSYNCYVKVHELITVLSNTKLFKALNDEQGEI